MEEIIIKDNVISHLSSITEVLYKKGYFGFKENAKKYVDEILDFIYNDLTKPFTKHKPTPIKLRRYGMFYATFSPNKQTSWYVFFNTKDSRYIVKFVTNNHSKAANDLNRL